jgi:taurine dioxygenase
VHVLLGDGIGHTVGAVTDPVRIQADPISGALGAEVRGVDLAALTDADFAMIEAALLQHLVLFFPDQHLTAEEHLAFAARFGEPEIHPFIAKLDDDHPEVVVLEGDDRSDYWHTDVTFSEHPPICSVLKMVTVPERGGDTMWTNQYLAYETLSAPIRDLLDGLTAVHMAPGRVSDARTTHPAVRVHPVTARRALYVNRFFTQYFVELSPSESNALLEYVCSHAEQPAFTCRYRWSPGCIAVWDNRVTQHYVVSDYDGMRRIERVSILGDDPVGDPPRWPPFDGHVFGYDRIAQRQRRATRSASPEYHETGITT